MSRKRSRPSRKCPSAWWWRKGSSRRRRPKSCCRRGNIDRNVMADPGDIVLRAQQITKRFAGVVALHGVGFSLRKGEVHALMGENGAGKSTLIKVINGIYKAD